MTRERVYYVFDQVTKENILQRLTLDDAIIEKRKRNKKEGYEKYDVKGSWVLHK